MNFLLSEYMKPDFTRIVNKFNEMNGKFGFVVCHVNSTKKELLIPKLSHSLNDIPVSKEGKRKILVKIRQEKERKRIALVIFECKLEEEPLEEFRIKEDVPENHEEEVNVSVTGIKILPDEELINVKIKLNPLILFRPNTVFKNKRLVCYGCGKRKRISLKCKKCGVGFCSEKCHKEKYQAHKEDCKFNSNDERERFRQAASFAIGIIKNDGDLKMDNFKRLEQAIKIRIYKSTNLLFIYYHIIDINSIPVITKSEVLKPSNYIKYLKKESNVNMNLYFISEFYLKHLKDKVKLSLRYDAFVL